ncbi:MAG: Transposase, OrfB family [Actinobacteria bacterium]|nr:Transposase, OrfB family [Actinomycetota bacterium]
MTQTLVAQIQVLPTPGQAPLLEATLRRANAAAGVLSGVAWERRSFGRRALQKAAYHQVRESSGLSAQVVIRLIAKVADAYRLDKKVRREFAPLGAIAYDARILRYFPDVSTVSIWTIAGRQQIPFVCGAKQRKMLAWQRGESDLVYRDGNWFLHATVHVPKGEPNGATDVLGVDLGIVNIAYDSDGKRYSGARLNSIRHRHRRLRGKLQKKGTKSSRRLLKKRRRKESRFARDVNHCISKKIVAKAQCTGRGIALEDLEGIGGRVKARKPQRATLKSWSFHQLGSFVEYKAALVGVPIVFVDPAYTSQECPACGHTCRANRTRQSRFTCVSCGLAGPADAIAALNIRARGRVTVMRPDAGEPGGLGDEATHRAAATVPPAGDLASCLL